MNQSHILHVNSFGIVMCSYPYSYRLSLEGCGSYIQVGTVDTVYFCVFEGRLHFVYCLIQFSMYSTDKIFDKMSLETFLSPLHFKAPENFFANSLVTVHHSVLRFGQNYRTSNL